MWLVPYIVSEITPKGVRELKKRDGEILKTKCNLSQLKLYVEKKTADAGGDTIEFTVAVDNKNPSTSVNTEPAPLWTITRLIIGILYQMNW